MDKVICDIENNTQLLIALMALITAVISIIIGIISLSFQRSHNKKSVLPIGTINIADYENLLQITISNNGTGPMIIKDCQTKGIDETRQYPIDWMPSGIIWETYRKNLQNHAILPGHELTLLKLSVDIEIHDFIAKRNQIRNILKTLELELKFADIYVKIFTITRKLDWFGRNDENEIANTKEIKADNLPDSFQMRDNSE